MTTEFDSGVVPAHPSTRNAAIDLLRGLTIVLTLSAGIPLIALHRETSPAPHGTLWLASMGKLSYEIYLTHMFVVYGAVAIVQANNSNPWFGFLWYVPVVLMCWLLGAVFAYGWSIPCNRALRVHWLGQGKKKNWGRRIRGYKTESGSRRLRMHAKTKDGIKAFCLLLPDRCALRSRACVVPPYDPGNSKPLRKISSLSSSTLAGRR